MTLTTNASTAEASPIRITLTDEALSSLPIYVSRVREPQGHAELETALDAVQLELRGQK